MEQSDLLQAPAEDLKIASLDSLEVTLDLGDLRLADATDENFDDLIARQRVRTGTLTPLQKCRLLLRPGGLLRLKNPHAGADAGSYLELQHMLLSMAGFVGISPRSNGYPLVVDATRRPCLREEYDEGMSLREVVDPADVLACHEFAREVYYYKDFNYDLEVATQFDPNADLYAIYDSSGRMLAIGRGVVRVPGYNCPFMYAVTDDGSHYRVPSRFRRICEVMGVFREGPGGITALKRLMEFVTQYAYHVAGVDSIWTTYDTNDKFTGAYYKNKLLMQEAGVRLTYRDFGGKWNLIWTDRIPELHELHRDMFTR
jgi:hypothetical protein